MADRNRTMDKAPTSPRDKASDDFTTEIMNMVVIASTIKFRENDLRFDNELPYLTYKRPSIKARVAQTIKLKIKPGKALGEKPERLSAINAFISFIELLFKLMQI